MSRLSRGEAGGLRSSAERKASAPANFCSSTAPVATLAPAAQDHVLRVGTKVPFKLAKTLITKGKKLRVRQHFNMEVAEPVPVNGQVVIPAGSPALGEITEVRNKGTRAGMAMEDAHAAAVLSDDDVPIEDRIAAVHRAGLAAAAFATAAKYVTNNDS